MTQASRCVCLVADAESTEVMNNDAVWDDLRCIFEEVSQAHSSLASKLAQHNGLRQFSADFSSRVAPLELRMLLPELETAIDKVLETLKQLDGRLQLLETTTSSRTHDLREAMRLQVRGICEERRRTFDDQRSHLRTLAAVSPLTSVRMSPAMNKRLSAALRSPPQSPPQSPPRSPPQSPRSRCRSVSSTTASQTSPPPELKHEEEHVPSLELSPGDEEFVLMEDEFKSTDPFPTGRPPFCGVLSILKLSPDASKVGLPHVDVE